MKEEKKFLIKFGTDNRYLKSFTTDEKGNIDDITTTINQDKAMHLDMDEAIEYKTDVFKFFKPSIVEEGTLIIHIPTREEYDMMYRRRLEHSSGAELCDEVLSRIDSTLTVAVVRKRLGYCFGDMIDIHYTNDEKEVGIEDVFNSLKYGGSALINGLKQYRWQCNECVEVIELGSKKHGGYTNYWIAKRYIIDFKYKDALEMLTDKKVKFPTTGYKEGYICERVWFGNTHDCMEVKDGKTVIKPFKDSSFDLYNK
jgi:hypothetical protein